VPFQELFQETQGSLLVPVLGDIGLQHLPFVIHSAPKIMLHAVDPHEHLVQVSPPAGGP
jgi:hypothetical protein